MSKIYTMSFTFLAVLSIGLNFMLRHEEQVDFNQDFVLETIDGDASIFDSTLELSAIISQGSTSHYRVTLTDRGPSFERIAFDVRHGLDDRQLANREFYRGTWEWDRENPTRTENYRILYNQSTTSRYIHILNETTGAFTRIADPHFASTRHGIFSVGWVSTDWHIFEMDGALYALGHVWGYPTVYHFDLEREILVPLFEISMPSTNGGIWMTTENGIYFYENDWETWDHFIAGYVDETAEDTLEASTNRLFVLDLETESMRELDHSLVGMSDWGSNRSWRDDVIIEGIVTTSPDGTQHMSIDGFSTINMTTGERRIFQSRRLTEIIEEAESVRGWTHWQETRLVGDYFITYQYINDLTQIISVIDLNTMEEVFIGRIHLRQDQGLRMRWGAVPIGFRIMQR